MAKFKVGDIVIGNKKNQYTVTAKGVKCKVTHVYDDNRIEVMSLFNKYDTYDVNSEYFNLVNNEEITIKRYGNKVVAKYGDKTAVAKCSPEDEFDFAIGAKLAFERLMGIKNEFKNEFNWDDFKANKFCVKCTKDNYENFVSEAKKHGCTFMNNANYNLFTSPTRNLMRNLTIFFECDVVKENEIILNFEDGHLKVGVKIPDKDIVTW